MIAIYFNIHGIAQTNYVRCVDEFVKGISDLKIVLKWAKLIDEESAAVVAFWRYGEEVFYNY